jgi:hypothetical protein
MSDDENALADHNNSLYGHDGLAPKHEKNDFKLIVSEPIEVRRAISTTIFRMRSPEYQLLLWSGVVVFVASFSGALSQWSSQLALTLAVCGLAYDLVIFPIVSYGSVRRRSMLPVGSVIETNFSGNALTVKTYRRTVRVAYDRFRKIIVIRGFVFVQIKTTNIPLVLPVELFPSEMILLVGTKICR